MQCEQYTKAWEKKNKREEFRLARMLHMTAVAGGLKRAGGGSLTVSDFLPEYMKPRINPALQEAKLKAYFTKLIKKNGK